MQNKVDLVSEERALESYEEIKKFVKDTVAENAPVIPVSAINNANIDALIDAIEQFMPTPERRNFPCFVILSRLRIDLFVFAIMGFSVTEKVFFDKG